MSDDVQEYYIKTIKPILEKLKTFVHTELDDDQITHLQNLTAIWGLLADLSFADLLLYGIDSSEAEKSLVLLGHVRPTTGTTLYRADMIGQVFESRYRPLITECFTWYKRYLLRLPFGKKEKKFPSIKASPIFSIFFNSNSYTTTN